MAVAPELFTQAKAKKALETVASVIVGPLGMCTLDPHDPEYRGDYVNSYDGPDKAVAQGWNYHQGPEWVWPLGYFLRAQHHFCIMPELNEKKLTEESKKSIAAVQCLKWLRGHRSHVQRDPWRSLPELTNSKGQHCNDSCPAQAWSIATLLDALHTADGEVPQPSAKSNIAAAGSFVMDLAKKVVPGTNGKNGKGTNGISNGGYAQEESGVPAG
jgi:glycogen debranching enzyme